MQIKFKLLIMLLLTSSLSVFSKTYDRGATAGGGLMQRSVSSSQVSVNLTIGKNTETFYISNDGKTTVSVKNLLGSVFYKKVIDTSVENILDINLLNLPGGSYTLTFTDVDGKTFERIYFKVR